MPVSTRSQILNQEQNEPNAEQRTRHRSDQEDNYVSLPLRNPHHGLKEKMKALTLLYEQQKKAYSAFKNQSPKPGEKRFSTHPSVELLSSCKNEEKREEKEAKDSKFHNVMRENKIPTMPNSTITRTFVLPQPPMDDGKENMVIGPERIVGFSSCQRKANTSTIVARKLSMGQQTEFRGTKNMQEMEKMEAVSEKHGMGNSRILVFVRLRPMAKKEKEAGLRCCVRIINRRDIYLTEFANENDYLRLKRLRGRHFIFDASFPDSATQQEVYSTT